MQPDADLVELHIAGRAYAGWTSVTIRTGIDAIAHSFEIGVTARWDPTAPEPVWEIYAGDECRVTIGGQTVVSGYIDALSSTLAAEDHSIRVSGRSKAGDLIDCSAVATPASWSGKTLIAIATELAKPFGIEIVAKADTGKPFTKFAIQQGESVFAVIERMCRMRGLLPVSKADGTIEIISPAPSAPVATLVQGQNILACSGSHDVSERFSRYIVKGQAAGTDEASGAVASAPKGEASDAGVKRDRPLLIISEDQGNTASLTARAKWEASVRAAKAQSVDVDVVGWRSDAGALWAAGSTVSLTAPAAWITADMMIAKIEFSIDDGGKIATLSLVRPEAYSQMPVPPEAEPSRIKKAKRS